jgi:protein TonB
MTKKNKLKTKNFYLKTQKLVNDEFKKEAKRIMNKLPQFTPGKQRRKPVKVKYTLPITFHVQ